MGINRTRIQMCPFCLFRYRVPEAFGGRSLSCKKCGTVFKLEFQATKRSVQGPPLAPKARGAVEKIAQDDANLLIGELAISHRLATENQIRQAIGLQEKKKRAGKDLPLGQILMLQGVIDPKQLHFLMFLQSLLNVRKENRIFGALAVKNKLATREQIAQALREQKRIFKEKNSIVSIGDLLVKKGVLTEQQRDAILSRQKGLHSAPAGPQERKGSSGAMAKAPERAGKEAVDLELRVSDDKLTAGIIAKEKVSSPNTLATLRGFLESKGITYGVLPDDQIRKHLKTGMVPGKFLKIAQGRAPEPGSGGEIKYFFDVDPLKVGLSREGEGIDFRDRGTIPRVNEGDLLAEKLPPKEGIAGLDVFGRPVPAPKSPKIRLRHGRGTRISEDGLKVFAAIQGRPELFPDGKLFVFPELKIQGDVDLKTGHIDFEGEVIVSGTVQGGFRVNSGSLSAGEILQAEIKTKGNVIVRGGIIGAVIRAGGSVKARHIREAHVEALGDVIAEKEVIDTRIETSGSVLSKRCRILSSRVVAKKGIQVHQVGSEESNPCTLLVGVNTMVNNEIKALKRNISSKEEEAGGLQKRTKALRKESKKVQDELGTTAQEQDRAMVQQRQLKERKEGLEATGAKEQVTRIEAALDALKGQGAKREELLENLFCEADRIEAEISDLQEKIALHEDDTKEIEKEIKDLLAWSRSEKGIPELTVRGTVFPYTTVKGVRASLTLPEKHENVKIKEVKTGEAGGKIEYKFQLTRL